MKATSILSDFLEALGVPHTAEYTDKRFEDMTFKSAFGLSKVLQDYGIDSEALRVADKERDLPKLTPPFLAQTADGFVIVEKYDGTKAVGVRNPRGCRNVPMAEFMRRWTGVVFLAFPHADASEPGYTEHTVVDTVNGAKRWVLAAAALFLFVYLFVTRGLWHHASLWFLTAVDLVGIYVTYQLMLKSLNIHSANGDRICGIIDRTGCHTVLNTEGSSFFGIVSWSEVGITYFGVSLAALLLFPSLLPALALINACCCPFSFWSVWYQKTKAKAWCTLCLITQGLLWLGLACYAFGGWFKGSFPLHADIFALGAAYLIVLLAINALKPYFDRNEHKN